MTTARMRTKLLLAAALAVPLALSLSACGKKGSPRAPEGQEADYTYPQPYPRPETVVPEGQEARPQPQWDEPLSIFDTDSRTTTKTY